MSDKPKFCQLTFVTKTGAQVQVMLAMPAPVVHACIESARSKNEAASLYAKVDDPKVEKDTLYIYPNELSFYSIIEPRPAALIHELDKKILVAK